MREYGSFLFSGILCIRSDGSHSKSIQRMPENMTLPYTAIVYCLTYEHMNIRTGVSMVVSYFWLFPVYLTRVHTNHLKPAHVRVGQRNNE
jgi:hypothetical protein